MSISCNSFYKFPAPCGFDEAETVNIAALDMELPNQQERKLYIFYPFSVKKAYTLGPEVKTLRDVLLFARARYEELYRDEERYYAENTSVEYCGRCLDFKELEITAGTPANNCAICQEEDSTAPTILTACEHEYHSACLARWFTDHNTCPLCRAPLVPCICNGARSKRFVFSDVQLSISGGVGPHGLHTEHMNELKFGGIAKSRNVYWLVGAAQSSE